MRVDLQESLLSISLSIAVPMRIIELQARGGPTDADRERASKAAEILGGKGDILQFGSKKKGEVAAVFNEVAFGIAVAAFSPGGIVVFGERYEGLISDEP